MSSTRIKRVKAFYDGVAGVGQVTGVASFSPYKPRHNFLATFELRWRIFMPMGARRMGIPRREVPLCPTVIQFPSVFGRPCQLPLRPNNQYTSQLTFLLSA